MGVVAKFGVSGVPFAGKRPVRSSITLAEIRAGNSNLGPESPEEPVSTQDFLPNDYPAPEAPTTQPTTNLTNDYPTYGPSITSELTTMSQGQNALSDRLPPQVIPTAEVRQSGQNLKLQKFTHVQNARKSFIVLLLLMGIFPCGMAKAVHCGHIFGIQFAYAV